MNNIISSFIEVEENSSLINLHSSTTKFCFECWDIILPHPLMRTIFPLILLQYQPLPHKHNLISSQTKALNVSNMQNDFWFPWWKLSRGFSVSSSSSYHPFPNKNLMVIFVEFLMPIPHYIRRKHFCKWFIWMLKRLFKYSWSLNARNAWF